MMTREERVEAVRKRWQDELDAKLAEREARGEQISSFARMQYEACPYLAELVIKLEDDLAAMKKKEEKKS